MRRLLLVSALMVTASANASALEDCTKITDMPKRTVCLYNNELDLNNQITTLKTVIDQTKAAIPKNALSLPASVVIQSSAGGCLTGGMPSGFDNDCHNAAQKPRVTPSNE